MSDGRILVGRRDSTSPEKTIKIKSLLKEDLVINNARLKTLTMMKHSLATSRLLSHTGIVSCSPEHLSLSDGSREVADDSREVAVHIEFDIEKKLKK